MTEQQSRAELAAAEIELATADTMKDRWVLMSKIHRLRNDIVAAKTATNLWRKE